MKIVIVGGGFGGLNAAKGLRRASGVEVVLVDRRNHHLFQPMLYQVATAGLSPAHIAAPIRSVLASQRNTEVVLADVERVDADKRVVVTDAGEIPYDVLVLATGATHSYFGKDAWANAAPGLKTVEDALEIRRRFLLAFEAAEQEKDAAKRRALMTFVVIGAGPTGVETAGAIAEIARTVLRRDFRHIDTSQARVLLIEGQDRVLPSGFPAELSERAKRDLEAMGVEVRLKSMVTDVRGGESPGVTVGDKAVGAETIDAHNIIWAAGVRGSPVGATIGAETDKAGRVVVGPDLSVPGHPEIFVIGDLAKVVGKDGQPVPGVCPAAVQMGEFVAGVIAKEAAGGRGPRPDFRYRDKGSLATIGRSRAVAWLPVLGKRWKFAGFIAWALWAGVHIFFLIGFRSRVMVMLEWIWAYIFFSRGARLITEPPEPGRPSGARAG